MQDPDNIPSNKSNVPPVCSLLSRRLMLQMSAASVGAVITGVQAKTTSKAENSFTAFDEIGVQQSGDIKLAKGFTYKNIIGFGDPMKKGMDKYDPAKLTADEQKYRFGGKCDFTHFFQDPNDENRGILCVNNESPEYGAHPNKAEREKAAYYSVGCSIVALEKKSTGEWQVDLGSNYNRRVTPDTAAQITGPAAGSDRLKNAFSKDGIKSAGTIGNCAGGFTPWGTYLTAEENIQSYFTGDVKKHPEKENMKRFGMSGRKHFYHKVDKRFDLNSDSQSPLHFGWVVEIDPLNPNEPIKKHSMLGRAKHECAVMTIDKNSHAVVYTSDDQAFEYIYKFVSKEKYIPGKRDHNKKLLESGTLYVAKFHENGKMEWLPLVFGTGPLTAKNGFKSQGDVLLDTRKAADLLEATPMDRPEDIAIHPQTGKTYFLMTGNRARKADRLNSANNVVRGSGHIIEMSGNHHESTADWGFLLICGQDLLDEKNGKFHSKTSLSGRFVYPDNACFDPSGEMWICSDGYGFPGFTDGLWHCDIHNSRGLTRRIATAPVKAEFTGPCFTKNGKELFLAVQHPGSVENGSFPDFNGSKARSSVVVISKEA